MIEKIVFIEPRTPGIQVYKKWSYIPRLGTVLLGTILKLAGYKIKIFIEEISKIDWQEVFSADLVGISTITSTAPRAYEFTKKITEKEIPVILGGPHPTVLPGEALKYANFVVRGEGEEVILPLVEAIKKGKGFENIQGLSYKLFGQIFHNPSPSFWCDLNSYPIPDFSLVQGWKENNIVPLQTSRGCPYNCKFCSVTKIFGRKLRHKNIERVIEEIKTQKSNRIFFCDDNFTAHKERTKTLLKRIIDEKLNIRWGAQIRTDAANDVELVSLMRKAGCFVVYIGMESINPESLKEMRKQQTIQDIRKSIRIFHQENIKVHGMFVIGFDTDDIKTIKETLRFAKKEEMDSGQFLILTPLPGTETYEELKRDQRLITDVNWEKYDGHHVVFRPKNIIAHRLQIEVSKASIKFYSWGQVMKTILKGDWLGAKIKFYGHSLSKKLRNQIKKDYLKKLQDLAKFSAKN
jgi:radical SAM superfamily enzyme YgiQ (UPF0313 family)